MTPRPHARGRRRFRECAECRKGYFGTTPTCHECRTGRRSRRLRNRARAQAFTMTRKEPAA